MPKQISRERKTNTTKIKQTTLDFPVFSSTSLKRKSEDSKPSTSPKKNRSSYVRSDTAFEISVPSISREQSVCYDKFDSGDGRDENQNRSKPTFILSRNSRKLGPTQTTLNDQSFSNPRLLNQATTGENLSLLSDDDDFLEIVKSTIVKSGEEEDNDDEVAITMSRSVRGKRRPVKLEWDDEDSVDDYVPKVTPTPVIPSQTSTLINTTPRRNQTLIDDDSEAQVADSSKRFQQKETNILTAPSYAKGSPRYRLRSTAAVVESPPEKKKREYTDKYPIKKEQDSNPNTNGLKSTESRLVKPNRRKICRSESPEELLEDNFLFFPAPRSTKSASPKEPPPKQANSEASSPIRGKYKGKINEKADNNDSEEEEDSLPIRKPRSRRQQRLSQQRTSSSDSIELPKQTRNDSQDLSGSDLDIVSEKKQILSSRTRYGSSPKKLNRFQKGLQKLNAKRKQRNSPISISDGESDVKHTISSSEEQEQEEEEDNENYSRIGGLTYDDIASPTGSGSEGGDSFVVDDDDEALLGIASIEDGLAPELTRPPIEFTSQSYQSLETHFKTVIQWMVHTFLCPDDFPKGDEYFGNAFYNLSRRVDSFRDSFVSSAWRGSFFTTMKKRPKMQWAHVSKAIGEHCVACNNRERHATYVAWFEGNLYDEKTLQDYSEDEDEDEGENEDEFGNIIASENERFPLGRFCFERAEITHSIWHWKKAQYWEVEEALRDLGCFTEEEREKMKRMHGNERVRWANGVLTMLEERGDVKIWYEMFKKLEETATEFVTRSGQRRY